jgi:hypothetical protein
MRMTSGWTTMARAMHRRCCWPPERLVAGACRRSLTSSHKATIRNARSVRSASTAPANAVQAQADGHVLGDGHGGKRVGFLEHHAHAAADDDRFHRRIVNVLAEQADFALHARLGDEFVHAVQGPEEG